MLESSTKSLRTVHNLNVVMVVALDMEASEAMEIVLLTDPTRMVAVTGTMAEVMAVVVTSTHLRPNQVVL